MGLLPTINTLGICLSIAALALYVHEAVTGGEYIAGVATRMILEFGMAKGEALGFAAAIILVCPIIAIAGLMPLRKC